jgi:hypothetical protein
MSQVSGIGSPRSFADATFPPATVAMDISKIIGRYRPAGIAYASGLLPVIAPREPGAETEGMSLSHSEQRFDNLM